ncbi:MAG: radical SAM family heme chaperone HemW [Bacteroidia bacterium]|nr:radical SAM family heme chaperone HemW [Bacteroidia bacterium]
MPGLYFHIPFCRKACTYCDFHFSTSLRRRHEMTEALDAELRLRSSELAGPLSTCYFGGGTPSLLPPGDLARLLDAARSIWTFAPDTEYTLEANPDDLNPDALRALRGIGFTRLSIGIQSFSDADLRWMNRSHDARQALACIPLAREAGFASLSIDLIFGLPGQDLPAWQRNLEQALRLQPDHLSVYALTPEPQTALHWQLRKDRVRLPEDQAYAEQFLLAHRLLAEAGYEHYELSNYARPGFRSRHNAAYWTGEPYLGIGPSAHSYDGVCRRWNAAHNYRYLQALAAGRPALESEETLSPLDRYHEYVMTGLRTAQGLSLGRLQHWIPDWEARFAPELERRQAAGVLARTAEGYAMTPEGWLMSDAVIRDFFTDALIR